jgi:peptide/nickel transport system substrate-binding protein
MFTTKEELRRTMKTKLWKLLTVMVILTMFATSLVGCGAPAPESAQPSAGEATKPPAEEPTKPPAEEPAEPVTMRVGTTYIWDTANPTFGWYGYNIRRLLYDTVVDWTGLSNTGPGLAESWSTSDDGLVWTFKIREGVTFHDGTPCTAEDVAWSLNWVIENDFETIAFYMANFEEVVALDDTTLQITLAEPVGNMISALLLLVWVMPRSVWEDMSYDEVMEFEDIAAATGTGPYKLVEWVEGEYLILEAYENYWRGKPPIDRIVYQEYATEDAMVQALLAGEIDDVGVPATAVETLKAEENIHVAVMPALWYDDFIINSHENGTQPASLMDPDVRLAIAHAIDKQQIVNVAHLGYAEPGVVVCPPSMGDWNNSEIVDIPFDPDEGNRILEKAGYVDSDGDGIREDLEGNPMEYRFYGEDGATQARTMEIIADGLAEIGISAPPTMMDEDSLIALYPDHDFDLLQWGWFLDADPDFAMMVLTCEQREEGGWGDSGYCNEEFEAMYAKQGVTVDHEERRQIIWDMQKKIFEDRPYIILAYRYNVEAYRGDRFKFVEDCGDFTWKSCLLQAEVLD